MAGRDNGYDGKMRGKVEKREGVRVNEELSKLIISFKMANEGYESWGKPRNRRNKRPGGGYGQNLEKFSPNLAKILGKVRKYFKDCSTNLRKF